MKINKQAITTIVVLIIIVGLMSVVIGHNSFNSQGQSPSDQILQSEQDARQEKVFSESNPTFSNQGEIIIYYGVTCPYCKDVANWIEEEGVDQDLEIVHKEVYEDKQNAEELTQVAIGCGLNARSIGVPFMYANEKCFSGKFEIIDYLQQQYDLVKQKTGQLPEELISPEATINNLEEDL